MAPRTCGSCAGGCVTSCCTIMGVKELDKPNGERCPKMASDGTCSIYAERPAACREWECVWLRAEDVLRNMDRPDRSGVILDVTNPPPDAVIPQSIVARETRPGAFGEDAAKKLLAYFQKRSLVILVGPGKRTVTGPPEMIKEMIKRRRAADRLVAEAATASDPSTPSEGERS